MTDDGFDLESAEQFLKWQRIQTLNEVNKIIAVVQDYVITLRRPASIDEYGQLTVGEWGGYLVQIVPMHEGDCRLALTPIHDPFIYDCQWQYRSMDSALVNMFGWNPETEADPHGFIRRTTAPREAGQRAVPPTPEQRALMDSALRRLGADPAES